MKRSKRIIMMLICIMALCACGKKGEEIEGFSVFEGRWQCAETPLEHPDYYTGYLVWMINAYSSFSMYDAEAGNPGIAGEMQIISDTELELHCNTEDDFDPPVTWEGMEETQVVSYAFINDKEMQISLHSEDGNSTLVFSKTE